MNQTNIPLATRKYLSRLYFLALLWQDLLEEENLYLNLCNLDLKRIPCRILLVRKG